MPLFQLIIKNNYADSDVNLPPSCNDFLSAFNPACLTMYCAIQTVTQTLRKLKAVGNNQEYLGLHSPLPLFSILYGIYGKKTCAINLNSWMLAQPQTVLI